MTTTDKNTQTNVQANAQTIQGQYDFNSTLILTLSVQNPEEKTLDGRYYTNRVFPETGERGSYGQVRYKFLSPKCLSAVEACKEAEKIDPEILEKLEELVK